MSVISEQTLYVGMVSDAAALPVGVLKLARSGVVESGEFGYGQRYVQLPDAAPLNPLYLPLQTSPFVLPARRIRDGGALPLTFRDGLPDSWGRKVLESQYGNALSDSEVLLLTNADRVGAMVFSAELPIAFDTPLVPFAPLAELADAAHRLAFSMDISPAMKRLLLRGSTLGGARPKATFIHDHTRWMAKFPARGDEYDVEILEAATLALAQRCGIEVSPFFVQALPIGHALVVKRFDRKGKFGREQRLHFLSASALLDVDYQSSGGSYVELAYHLRRISADPAQDLQQLYSRLIFNLVIDNSDDHVKNHGVLRTQGYRLSPAFDLVPQLNHIGYQQLAILPARFESHLDLAREAAPHFGLTLQEANARIAQITQIVHADFRITLNQYGADASLIERVADGLNKQAQWIAS